MFLKIRDDQDIPCEAVRVIAAPQIRQYTAKDGLVEIVVSDKRAEVVVRLVLSAHQAESLEKGIAAGRKELSGLMASRTIEP